MLLAFVGSVASVGTACALAIAGHAWLVLIELPPMQVNVTRGTVVETEHTVVASIVSTNGTPLVDIGDAARVTPVRSSAKSLQLLPMVETGAADAFSVTAAEISLASASHNGEPAHAAAVVDWLDRIGLTTGALQCGPSRPMPWAWPHVDADWIGHAHPTKHDCSGKHVGFLTLSQYLDADPADYLNPDGQVQKLVLAAVADRCGVDATTMSVGTDGCGAPVPAITVREFATGMAKLTDRDPIHDRVIDSISAHPWFLAGTSRFDTRLTEHLAGTGFSKIGADGVRIIVSRPHGIGIAMKAVTGSHPACAAAMFSVLESLGLVAADDFPDLASPPVKNNAGLRVGELIVQHAPDLAGLI